MALLYDSLLNLIKYTRITTNLVKNRCANVAYTGANFAMISYLFTLFVQKYKTFQTIIIIIIIIIFLPDF